MPVSSRSSAASGAANAALARLRSASAPRRRRLLATASMPAAALDASPPGSPRSITTIRPAPRRASSRAIAHPITPAPMIATSGASAMPSP